MDYTTPELRNLGSLATLTLGNSGSSLDGGSKNITEPPSEGFEPVPGPGSA
jgi:hypothetical protein